jgi:cysteine-rich repeat protein
VCSLAPDYCGSGTDTYGTKQCDDMMPYAGDEYTGDGCDWNCLLEIPISLAVPEWTGCGVGAVCVEVCGALSHDFYSYECDDGNNLDGDGCSATCMIEYGYNCTGGSPMDNDVCFEICGDGKVLGL